MQVVTATVNFTATIDERFRRFPLQNMFMFIFDLRCRANSCQHQFVSQIDLIDLTCLSDRSVSRRELSLQIQLASQCLDCVLHHNSFFDHQKLMIRYQLGESCRSWIPWDMRCRILTHILIDFMLVSNQTQTLAIRKIDKNRFCIDTSLHLIIVLQSTLEVEPVYWFLVWEAIYINIIYRYIFIYILSDICDF